MGGRYREVAVSGDSTVSIEKNPQGGSSVCFVKCGHYLSLLLISLSEHFRKLQISSLESLVLCGIRFYLTGSVVEVISELISVLPVIALSSRFTNTDLVLLHDFRPVKLPINSMTTATGMVG